MLLRTALPKAPFPVGAPRRTKPRSKFQRSEFLEKQCVNVQGKDKDSFLVRCEYFVGGYDCEADFARLHEYLCELEGYGKANKRRGSALFGFDLA